MSNKTSSKAKEADADGSHIKMSAVKSSKVHTVKHDGAALAIATKKARQQGGGAIRTAGRNPVQP
jgi:hypothetical protein